MVALKEMAAAIFRRLPRGVRAATGDIAFMVQELPEEGVWRDLGLEGAYDLLGLYQGVSLDLKSSSDVAEDLDRIFLYRQPILLYCRETGETLEEVVRHVLIHEIGHHLGFSDEDMERLQGQ